ncbi:MAG: hypothetical protein LH619_09865 [Chitinophagaceae bacterium]|nr:hypothetical protein [Chitinophagaceae bacterium]
MIKITFPILFLSIALIPQNCKEDVVKRSNKKSKADILVQHIWQVDEVRRNIDGENS